MAREIDVRVPFKTLLKIALTILLIAMVVKLWPVTMMTAPGRGVITD